MLISFAQYLSQKEKLQSKFLYHLILKIYKISSSKLNYISVGDLYTKYLTEISNDSVINEAFLRALNDRKFRNILMLSSGVIIVFLLLIFPFLLLNLYYKSFLIANLYKILFFYAWAIFIIVWVTIHEGEGMKGKIYTFINGTYYSLYVVRLWEEIEERLKILSFEELTIEHKHLLSGNSQDSPFMRRVHKYLLYMEETDFQTFDQIRYILFLRNEIIYKKRMITFEENNYVVNLRSIIIPKLYIDFIYAS